MSSLSHALLEVTYSLIPVFGQDDFDDVFEMSAGEFTVGDQYKIRNELIRLCEPCEKVIDLRGEVDQKCRKFVYKGRVHYLDEIAKETFEQGVERFGNYTTGVWEEVTNTGNNFRVMQKRAEQERLNAQKYERLRKAEKLQNILATKLHYDEDNYPAHVIGFGDYFNRAEERMNYAVAAKLTFADGRSCEATTKDLSVTGLFLRIPLCEQVEMDEAVKVVLSEQLNRYKEIAPEGIEYQIKRIEAIDKVIWLGLNRTYSEAEDLFSDYAKELIASNKFVYKVNLDNAIDAVLKMGHEQVFFARAMTMALFVHNNGGHLSLKYGLCSGPNEENLKYFVDDSARQYLPSLFSGSILKRLCSGEPERCLLYCFTHKVEGNLLYFAAFDWQLAQDDELYRLFVGYGSKKDSWKVFSVCCVRLEQADAAVTFSVPGKVLSENETTMQGPTDGGAMDELANVGHALLLTEVVDELSCRCYGQLGFDSELMAKITQFQLAQTQADISWLKYGLEELRNEPRFAYKTKVFVGFDNGMRLEATSVDFSARGVMVALPRPMAAQKRDIVRLSFPLLQKITRQLQLDNLQYRVVGTVNDQKTLYLQAVEVEEQMHHGVKFFKDLIKRNQHKLTLVSESTQQMRLTRALKNLIQKRLNAMVFFINRVNGRLRLTKLVSGDKPHPLLEKLKSDEFMGKVNIAQLMANSTFESFIASFAKGVDEPSKYQTMQLFVAVSEQGLVVKSNAELNNETLQRAFVESAEKDGQFYCFKAFLFGVARVQLRKIADELEYIHHYAQHKSKYIALSLTRIISVGELVDVSDFVRDYLQLGQGKP